MDISYLPISTSCLNHLLLLLPTTQTQCRSYTAEAETTEQLVDTQPTEQAIDNTAQTKTVEQLANQTEDTAEEQPDGGDDLEERLGEQAPERVETLLGVRHIGNLLLGVVDGLDDGGG